MNNPGGVKITIVGIVLFNGGLIVGALLRLQGIDFAWDQILITDILSPSENSRAGWFAISTTLISAIILLLGLMPLSFSPKNWQQRVSLLGKIVFGIGLVSVTILCFTSIFESKWIGGLHIMMAYASFLGITGGLTIRLIPCSFFGSIKLFPTIFLLLFLIIFGHLCYQFYHPHFFEDRYWLLAIYEWMLIALISFGIIFSHSWQEKAS